MKVSVANIQGKKYKHLNISDIVGIGGKNQPSDVMLIQAFFNYIGRNPFTGFWITILGGDSLPEITGKLDEITINAIIFFQLINSPFLYNPHIDCRIHPANYENRQINNVNRMMIITRLNHLAYFRALMDGKDSFIHDLTQILIIPRAKRVFQ